MNPSSLYSGPTEDLDDARMSAPLLQPPRLTVVQALLRNWFLVLVPAIVLAAVGAAVAFSRPATYTAEARLSVGKANPSSPAFGGFVTAAAGLATVYSRAINAPAVTGSVSRQLHWKPGLVDARLSATPVQDTPIIRVIGKAPSSAEAQAVANAGATGLTQYVTTNNRQDPDSRRLLNLYHSVALQKAQNATDLASAQKALGGNPGDAGLKAHVNQDEARASALSIQANAISSAYVQSLSGQASTEVLQPLGNADSASSNRSSQVQTLAGVGLLAGLVLGVGLAMWRANALVRRRFAT